MKESTETFNKMVIDLSGRSGLVDRFYGNYPYSTPNQYLDIYAGSGQYATGVVNPIAKYGFLSPANNTAISVSSDIGAMISATELDETQSDPFAFFYGFDGTINRTTSLTQTSITATPVSIANTIGTDLEWYTVAGIRKLFFSYKGNSSGDIGVWDLTGVSGTGVNGTSIFLNYTTQTANFTVGDTLTGALSAATGHISTDTDYGATGTLLLTSVTGNFQDGEIITDGGGGSATSLASGPTGLNSSVYPHFMSRAPVGAFFMGSTYLQMRVADNGFMYILDGSSVHKFDGSISGGESGTVTPNVLEFPPQYTLTDGIDLRGRLWITLFRSTRDIFSSATNTAVYNNYCGVYVWDRATTGTSTEDFILVPGVREIRSIHTFQGVPTLFTVSSTRFTEVRMWNGSTFKVVAELGPEAYPHFHDSVSVKGDLMVWQGNDGQMYAYGKLVPDAKNALYQFGDMTTQITNSTTFRNASSILLGNETESTSAGENSVPEAYYLGITDTSKNKLLRWYPHALHPNNNTQQAATGNYFTPVKILPKLSYTHFLTLFFPPVGSGGTTTLMNVNLYINQSTTPWNAVPIPLTQDDAQRSYKTIPFNQQGVNSIQMGITYATTTSIASIPTLSHALLEYNPTSKRY